MSISLLYVYARITAVRTVEGTNQQHRLEPCVSKRKEKKRKAKKRKKSERKKRKEKYVMRYSCMFGICLRGICWAIYCFRYFFIYILIICLICYILLYCIRLFSVGLGVFFRAFRCALSMRMSGSMTDLLYSLTFRYPLCCVLYVSVTGEGLLGSADLI